MSSFSKGFLTGILSGAILGTTFALLFAPEKGYVTRDKLSFRFGSYLDELVLLKRKLIREKNHLENEAKSKGDEIITQAQLKAEEMIKEVDHLIQSIQQTTV